MTSGMIEMLKPFEGRDIASLLNSIQNPESIVGYAEMKAIKQAARLRQAGRLSKYVEGLRNADRLTEAQFIERIGNLNKYLGRAIDEAVTAYANKMVEDEYLREKALEDKAKKDYLVMLNLESKVDGLSTREINAKFKTEHPEYARYFSRLKDWAYLRTKSYRRKR